MSESNTTPPRMNANDPTVKWGAHAPSGYRKILFFLIRSGLSRGGIKRYLQRLWLAGGARVPVDIEYFGVKFRLQPWDNVVERKILFGSKRRDWKEISFLAANLDAESVFFDIGANIGYYSCMLAASGVQRVIAVEPHPVTQHRLRFNIETNGFQDRVNIVPLALGSAEGEVVLTTRDGDLGSSSVGHANVQANLVHHTVKMLPLQELCKQLNISRIDAAKIDIEGLEDKVLIPFFEKAPPSLWPHYLVMEHAHSAEWGNDLFTTIRKCGYQPRLRTRANTIYQLADG